MGHEERKLYLPIVLSVMLVLMVAGLSLAGEFHTGTALSCNQCHVMHATDQHAKTPATYNGGNGYNYLLKYGTVPETCFGCHGGTSSTPGILASGTGAAPTNLGLNTIYYADDPYLNSSGFFQSDWKTAANPQGHDMYTTGTPVTAVQGTWTPPGGRVGMDCSDCHAVHGSANWRNLRTDVGGKPLNTYTVSYASNGSGPADVEQNADLTTDTSPKHYETQYQAFSTSGATDIVNWCVGCHKTITTGSKHPQNVAVSSGDSSGMTDSNAWKNGTGLGFGTTVDDGATGGDVGIPRVRFAQSGSSYSACSAPDPGNQVFCLTCHKAHGSKYSAAVCWPMSSGKDSLGNRYDPVDKSAGCRQCHPQGQS